MKRPIYYPFAASSGFVVGALIGIDGRNCSHPEQSPFLQCITEDPLDVLGPAIALALLAVALVGAFDVSSTAVRNRPESHIPPWRRWMYVGLLFVAAFPAAWIAIEQAVGGHSDGDPFLIFILGTWILTPVILVEFVVWLLRRFSGPTRLIPLLALITTGAVTYVASSGPDLSCIVHSDDFATCYDAMPVYLTNFVVLCAMVGAFFLPKGESQPAMQPRERSSGV